MLELLHKAAVIKAKNIIKNFVFMKIIDIVKAKLKLPNYIIIIKEGMMLEC